MTERPRNHSKNQQEPVINSSAKPTPCANFHLKKYSETEALDKRIIVWKGLDLDSSNRTDDETVSLRDWKAAKERILEESTENLLHSDSLMNSKNEESWSMTDGRSQHSLNNHDIMVKIKEALNQLEINGDLETNTRGRPISAIEMTNIITQQNEEMMNLFQEDDQDFKKIKQIFDQRTNQEIKTIMEIKGMLISCLVLIEKSMAKRQNKPKRKRTMLKWFLCK